MKEVQKFINDAIQQRSQIWQEYDAVEAKGQSLNERAKLFKPKGAILPWTSPLTPNNLPPEEVLAVITKLDPIERDLVDNKNKIKQNEAEIENLKQRSRNIIIVSSVIATIFSFFLLGSITSQPQPNSPSHSSTN